ncbi:synaptosomal-associated protein 29-like [Branchiostoma floridae x Branchiostoma belcheri]
MAYGQTGTFDKTNPFADDDDDLTGGDEDDGGWDLMRDELATRQGNISRSTQRCLGAIAESERVGVATAEELLHQREQLERTEKNLDKINKDLDVSQRHITSIKSMWGGVINFFKKKPQEPPPVAAEQETKVQGAPKLRQAMEASQNQPRPAGEHPAMQLRDESRYAHGTSQSFQKWNAEFEDNLDDMSTGLGTLKSLAMGLNDEITEQNAMLDRLGDKTDKSELRIHGTNKEMRNMLK